MQPSASSYNALIAKLDEFIRKYYKNRLVKGVIYSITLSLAFFLTVTVTEYYAHFDTGMRTFLFWTFVLCNLGIIGYYIIDPLLRMNKLGRIISHEQASAIIGRHFTTVQDKLINVLQLRKVAESSQQETTSQQLLLASIEQKTKELKPIPFTSAIDLTQNKRYLKFALIPLAVFVFILFSAPSIITDSTNRLVNHSEDFVPVAPFQFVVVNDPLKAVQQEDYEVKVKLTGSEIPEGVTIQVGDNEYKLEKDNTVNFHYVFKNIQKDVKFRLSADGFRSAEYSLLVMPNPLLLDFDITMSYPAYLGKKDEVVKNTGDLVVPAGTRVSWKFNTQNTDKVRMSFTDTAVVLDPSGENTYTYSQRLLKDKSYSVTTSNSWMKSRDSVVYAINVVPDQYPGIQVEEKKDSVFNKKMYFTGQVKDDHGFTRLTFNYRLIHASDSLKQQEPDKLNAVILPVSKTLTQDQFYQPWDLSTLNIQPGDQVEYYFEVFDNDGVNGSKSARSEKKLYKAPTLRELSDKTDQQNEKLKDEMTDAMKDIKDIQKQIADLNKKLLEKQNLTWEEKKKMQDLLSKQKELQDKIEKMKNENAINNQQQQEFQKNSESLQEKQKQLEDLFNQVMNDEMKKKYEELQKLMDKMDKDKMQDMLDKMKMDTKDVEKELDRQLEMFKKLEVEQKMEDITRNLDELSKKQDDLSKESQKKDADKNDLQKKQEDLNKQFDDIKKDLKDLEQKNGELEKPDALPNTEQQQQDIQQEQQKSSDDLKKNDKKGASKSQKSAAQKMQQMSQQLSQSMQDNEQQSSEEDINSLRQILSNLVQLSFDQEALMGQFGKTKTENPQFVKLIQQQKKLKDDSKVIEDSLLALSKRVFQLQSIINKEITSINYNMDKSIEHFVDAQGAQTAYEVSSKKQSLSEGESNQQYAMTSMNNLALLLSEALQQMQAQSQSQTPGMGSCNKPGGKGSPKPSAGSMKKLQEQLNQQIEALKKQMEEGKKNQGNKKGPDGKQGPNGQGGQGGMSEQLVKLAAQQEALRQMMQELMNQGGDPGGMKNTMKQMEETETDIVNKNITQETMKRQQEILTKLLDYEKAEKEREQDNKRESKEGKNDADRNQKLFLEYNRQKQKEAELLKTLPPSLTPYYKGKVNEYFNNFEK
jgi:hypothetical protein